MIELRDIFLNFGRKEVLKGINLTIDDGKITAILGPSGSGKSTIVKLMLGLIKPTSGKVLVRGVDITNMSEADLYPIRKLMGMVFQGNALFDSLSVAENMGFFLKENLKLPPDEIARRVADQIAFAGLEGYEQNLPDTLSGGMKKRLAIGRALIFDPNVLLLDEPTVGLDPVNTKKILDLIKRLREERGLGGVMVTHIINDVFGVADRVVILYQGSIIFDDVPERMEESEHPFIASFIKDPDLV